jgi:hypothetical protein
MSKELNMILPEIDARHPDEELADYLFDLNGFLIIRNAVAEEDISEMNRWVDDHWAYVSDCGDDHQGIAGKWIGHIETHTYSGTDGTNFQNIVEGGLAFEKMIDHPSWVDRIRRYVNPTNGLSIHENLLSVRGKGGYIGIHSGGHMPISYMTFRQENTHEWMVGQINVITALTDIGPGDGCTTLIPGSHKATIPHPRLQGGTTYRSDEQAGNAPGMIELHLEKGDTLMFTDCITHGSSERTNDGHRRITLYRYSPRYVATRFNYKVSDALLERLTEDRRNILQPIPPRCPQPECALI